MFYNEYLNRLELELFHENYSDEIINSIDDKIALDNIKILQNHNCDFINDLIVNYLEIFFKNSNILETRLKLLKNELGEDYLKIIEGNMNLLID